MSRKKYLNNKRQTPTAKSGFVLFIIVFSFLLIAFRSDGGKDFVLFTYSDIENGSARVKGYTDAIVSSPKSKDKTGSDMGVTLVGGKSVYITKKVKMDLKGKEVRFNLKVGGINSCRYDYQPGEAKYPFFLQLVFDEGPDGLGVRKWVKQKFKAMRDEKVKTQRNIIYAFGNKMPKGSIVNAYPGGVVISIGDEGDCGRMINVKRDLESDYLFSFGKEIDSRLVGVIVGFEGYKENKESIPVSVSEITLSSINSFPFACRNYRSQNPTFPSFPEEATEPLFSFRSLLPPIGPFFSVFLSDLLSVPRLL
jgi:hypothetical protein